MKCIICVGPPNCGKTTFAKSLEGYVDINRDYIRFTEIVDNKGIVDWSLYKFTKAREKKVSDIVAQEIQLCYLFKRNIIISDTNLNEGRRNNLIKFLESLGYEVEIKDDWDIPHFETLVKRNENRQGGVATSVLWNMWVRWLEYKGFEKYKPTGELPQCVIVDIDGSVAQMNGRGPFDWERVGEDLPRQHVIDIVEGLSNKYHVVFLSGRDGSCWEQTLAWLEDNVNVPQFELLMRPAGNCEKDYIVKRKMFDQVAQQYDVSMVIDDRNQVLCMWMELGIPVINVGNMYESF